MLVPAHITQNFEMWDAQKHKDRWVIELREKEGRISTSLSSYEDKGGVNKLNIQIWSNNVVPLAVKFVSFYIYFFKLLIANFNFCLILCII
jgi:hypothetical protein